MKKGLSLIIMILTVLLMTNSIFVSAITGAIGNARMVIYSDVGTNVEKSILVKNVNNVPLNITLVPDSDGKKFIEMKDPSFILSANTDKKAVFILNADINGSYQGKIDVFFTPISATTNGTKEPGVALTSNIIFVVGGDNESGVNYGDDESDTTLTGNVINGNIGKVLIFGLGTLILVVILLSLVYLSIKKKRNKKGERINGIRDTK